MKITGITIIAGLIISVALFPIIGIYDIWDNTNELVLDKMWQTDILLIISFGVMAFIFGKIIESEV